MFLETAKNSSIALLKKLIIENGFENVFGNYVLECNAKYKNDYEDTCYNLWVN